MNLNQMALTVHPKVLAQDKIFQLASEVAVKAITSSSQAQKNIDHQSILRHHLGGNKNKIIKKSKKVKEKTPTHFLTKELLCKKLSLADIAKARELTTSTIVGHIEKLRGLSKITLADIEHLKNDFSKDMFAILFVTLKESDDGHLSPVYEKFGGKYSYEMIRVVRLFIGTV